jgi:hypothetical protein
VLKLHLSGAGAAALIATLALVSASASAQEKETSLDDVEQRVRILERQLELAEEEAAAKAKNAAVPVADEKGFALRSADNSFELKFRALAQGDARFLVEETEPPLNDTFAMRRLRPIFEASLGKLITVRLTPEFAGPSATIVDAYLDFKLSPLYTVRVGKTKGPVSLERLQSGGATMFIERAYPAELAPNRDIGVMLTGEYDGGVFSYTTPRPPMSTMKKSSRGGCSSSRSAICRGCCRVSALAYPAPPATRAARAWARVACCRSTARPRSTLSSSTSPARRPPVSTSDSRPAATGTAIRSD